MMLEKKTTGTQAIERSIHLLKLLATRGKFGWGLTDLSRRSGLEKGTVHRILACLESERLVERDVKEHRYFPGPMLVELGLSTTYYPALLAEARATISRLAHRTGGVSFFYLRSGLDFVVAGRVEHSLNRGMINDEGFRRPLIMSAGGVAMLIAMPKEERDVIVKRNLQEVVAMGIPRPERFENMFERSLKLGYAANLEDVVSGINSFAVCLFDHAGTPLGSISLAGDPERFPADSAARYCEILVHEATELAGRSPRLSSVHASEAIQAAMLEAVEP